MSFYKPVILDSGSGSLKAGFSGDRFPRVEMPSIVGTPKKFTLQQGMLPRNFIGQEVLEKRAILSVHSPFSKGVIQDWNLMEDIWDYVFKSELKTEPENHSFLLTESPFCTRTSRDKIFEVMFESFGIPALQMVDSSTCALYASGRTVGLVVESGESSTYIVPIEDYPISHAKNSMHFAGQDLTDYLARMLSEKGFQLVSTAEKQIVKMIKEQLCYVSPLSSNSCSPLKEAFYELPDGQKVFLDKERVLCPDALFVPDSLEVESYGLHHIVVESILDCDNYLHPILFDNIVLSGGNTLFQGLKERLEKEMYLLCGRSRINIHAFKDRKYFPWKGAEIISELTSLKWIRKDDYLEFGSSKSSRSESSCS